MRRRRAVAATALGVAGVLLPARAVGAAEFPDRHREYREDVTFATPGGGTDTCTVVARLDWTFGEEGPQDNVLRASTHAAGGPDCDQSFPSFFNAGVTLRWRVEEFRRGQRYTYTAEGDVEVAVAAQATPLDAYGDGMGADQVSSEHQLDFDFCSSNCTWSHTLTFDSK